MKPIVYLCYTNDLITENRGNKFAYFFESQAWNPTLVGRQYSESKQLTKQRHTTKRLSLFFRKGFLFYTEYNIRLFFFLLLKKKQLIVANDLDTLGACYLASILTRTPLWYDSHEYFTEVPELQNSPRKKKIWEMLEKFIFPKLKYASTVCESISNVYKDKYKIAPIVIRNVPLRDKIKVKSVKDFGRIVLIYQGALNIGRGIELMIATIALLPLNYSLYLVGDGDCTAELKQKVKNLKLEDRIIFTGKKLFNELKDITNKAHIGFSLEENMGLNYYFALPNKLFDYIQAQIPVIVSNLPEMKRIIERYTVGKTLESRTPEALAELVLQVMEKHTSFDHHLHNAAQELCWENEQSQLQLLLQKISKENK